MAFFHGVETISVDVLGSTIQIVRSAVVALIGIAPTGAKNALTLCLNDTDDAQFGRPVPGFNIPKTLEIIRQIAGSCPVLVVNVFDATTHTTAVALESQTVTAGKLKLAFAPVGTVSVFNTDGTTPSPIVKDTDYTLDAYGNFQVISNAITNGTQYKFTYKKLNAAAVTANVLVGEVNSTTEVRSGIKLLDLSYNLFGFTPKILIAPLYATLSAVVTEMRAIAAKYRAVWLQDLPYQTTVAGALAGRGPSGTIQANTSDPRTVLLYPYVKNYDKATGLDVDFPYSAFMAGVMVKSDQENGYWESPSNKEIPNATGVERAITWNINDAGSEANTLNAAGITTIAQGYGTGIRTWGNRNASFPTSTSVKNFVNLQRIDDIIAESMEQGALEDLDKGITQAFIDIQKEKGNRLMKLLIQQGALLPGSRVIYNPDDNPDSELAAGHITFERIYMGPPSAERITFKSVIDITLLSLLK